MGFLAREICFCFWDFLAFSEGGFVVVLLGLGSAYQVLVILYIFNANFLFLYYTIFMTTSNVFLYCVLRYLIQGLLMMADFLLSQKILLLSFPIHNLLKLHQFPKSELHSFFLEIVDKILKFLLKFDLLFLIGHLLCRCSEDSMIHILRIQNLITFFLSRLLKQIKFRVLFFRDVLFAVASHQDYAWVDRYFHIDKMSIVFDQIRNIANFLL